jgi:threonine aldolase
MDRTVHFRSDGLALSPAEYARLLVQLAQERGIAADEFSREGVVVELEQRMATLLGKEMALFLPSGTLANHLALRVLTTRGRRVLVQRESHIYNDTGDCTQELSGLTLIPSLRSARPSPSPRSRSRSPVFRKPACRPRSAQSR